MGTWKLPYKSNEALSLSKAMEESLSAKDASDKLYYLLGDDDLYDSFEEEKRVFGEDTDVRELVRKYVEKMLHRYENKPSDFNNTFSEDALKLLKEMAR